MTMMNQMVRAIPKRLSPDTRVPIYVKELLKRLSMPPEFRHNIEAHLQSGNDHARMYVNYESLITLPHAFRENIMVLLLKRFGMLGQDTVEWWAKAPIGSTHFPHIEKPKSPVFKKQVLKKEKHIKGKRMKIKKRRGVTYLM